MVSDDVVDHAMPTPTIADADALAARAHHGQVDKAGRPYIDHPRTVARILADQTDNLAPTA